MENKMDTKQQFLNLIHAQNEIRRVWAIMKNKNLGEKLSKIDKELTKILNELGKKINDENIENDKRNNINL